PVAWKVLRHLTHTVVRNMRVSNLRLREAIALNEGEQEAAFRAREQARTLARAPEPAPLEGDRLPVVRPEEPQLSAAACLTSLLRRRGRPVPPMAVAEALSENARITPASLERGARSFGLTLRPLELTPGELRALESPLLLHLGGDDYVLAERWRGG